MSGGLDGSSDGVDIMEIGSRTPRRRSGVVATVALAVAALIGAFWFGARLSGAPPAARPSATAATGLPALTTGENRCSAQIGDQLQLGIEVVNRSDAAATVLSASPVLPMGGLRAAARSWRSCGSAAAADDPTPHDLPARASTWLTFTFDVLEYCPAPIPVSFVLAYSQSGRADTAQLAGFNDLADVPYTGCSARPSS